MARRVTIKSIAQDLGISHMTVSRSLSNNPNVREETRNAVLARAEELGYVRSAVASAMRGEATGIIGLLLPNIVNEFYARFANALALACEDRGIQVITHLTNDELHRETHALMQLAEVQADGVVMVPAPGVPEDTAARQLGNMNAIQLIRQRENLPGAESLLLKDGPAIGAAVDHLAQKGHNRIAYIGAHTAISSGRDRLAAFEDAMRKNDLEIVPELICTAPPSFAMGQQSANTILTSEQGATALVCGGIEISNGALESFLRAGTSFPDQVAFIGYGDPAFYEWIQGGISTVSLPVDHLAERATELVCGGGDPASPPQDPLPAALVIRNSA